MQELASQGLIDILRNKGARVRSVSLREAIEITEVRSVLEGLAAAKAAQKVTAEQAEVLRELGPPMNDAVERSDYDQYLSSTPFSIRWSARLPTIARRRLSLQTWVHKVVRYQFRLSRRAGRLRCHFLSTN